MTAESAAQPREIPLSQRRHPPFSKGGKGAIAELNHLRTMHAGIKYGVELIVSLPIKITVCLAAGLVIWLPIILSAFGERNEPRFELDGSSNYVMRQPRFVLWIGVIDAAFCFVIIVTSIAVGNKTMGPLTILGFTGFALLGTFLAVYVIQWRITVKRDLLIIRMPFHRAREVKLGDISMVKYKYSGIIGYINGKRVFAADNIVSGFDLLCVRLYEAGKMELTQRKDGFTVRQNKGNIVVGVLGLLFSGGCLIWTIFWPNESVNSFVYAGFSGFILLSLYLLIHSLRWKLTVIGNTVISRNLFGSDQSISIKDLSKVNVKKDSVELLSGKRKITKVALGCSNFSILMERLHSEKIPFYENDNML